MLHISCSIGTCDLPDMYALSPRACGPRTLGMHIRQITRTVMPQLVPRHNWSPGPSAANYVAVGGPPEPSMAAMDGPPCRKWSPGSKPEKQWLQLQTDLYNIILTDEFEVTIKIFRNNAMHVCCNSESSLAATPCMNALFLLTHSRSVIWATTG